MEVLTCAACLSTDRKVFSAKSFDATRFGFQFIHDAKVCWECKKVFENIQIFRDKVTQAQTFLNSSTRNKTIVSLSSLSVTYKDTYDKVYLHNDSVETEPFVEIKVKGEPPEPVKDTSEPVQRDYATNELDSSLKYIPNGLLKTVLKEEVENDPLEISKSKMLRFPSTQFPLSLVESASVTQSAEMKSLPIRIKIGNKKPSGKSGTQNYCTATFECGDCGNIFRSKPLLQQHIEVEHVNKLLYSCRQCPEKYTSELSMFVHERKAHHTKKKAKKQPLICRRCDKSFTSREGLKQHQNTHTGARPYACDVCGDAFGYRSVLYVHRRLKHLGLKRSSKLKTDKT